MFGRQRTTITREGAYFALVVLFILGGAALRQVNLLVTFAGLLVAPAIFHWRIVALTLRKLRMRRRFRPIVHAGEPLDVTVEMTNQNPRLGAWAISIEDTVNSANDNSMGRGFVFLPTAAPEEPSAASYQVVLPRRGRYTFGPLVASTRFPLGLFCSWLTYFRSDAVLALPRLGELKEPWLDLFESRRIGREMSGGNRSGNDGDFYALREWRSGDSRRWIHWRSTARLNYPVVRQLEQPRRREAGVIVDLWVPPDATEEDRGWVEMTISFAATVIESLVAAEGRHVHVVLCASETTHWSGDISRRAVQSILRSLAVVDAAEKTDVAHRVVELNTSLRAESQLVVLSTRGIDHFDLAPTLGRRTHWVNVRSDELARYFELPPLPEPQTSRGATPTPTPNPAETQADAPVAEPIVPVATPTAGEG